MPRRRGRAGQRCGVVAGGVRRDALAARRRDSANTALVAPRALKAPIFWKVSHLKNSCAPLAASSVVAGQHRGEAARGGDARARGLDHRPGKAVGLRHTFQVASMAATVRGGQARGRADGARATVERCPCASRRARAAFTSTGPARGGVPVAPLPRSVRTSAERGACVEADIEQGDDTRHLGRRDRGTRGEVVLPRGRSVIT